MTIRDQATELRQLVLQAAREDRARQGPAPRLVIVTGGGAGVGSTALAINLAVAFGDLGMRTVLVDAAEDACIAERCGLEPVATIGDIMTARRNIHEVLIRGLSGIQVAPGDVSGRYRGEAAGQRLVGQLKTLGRHADLVLVDAGAGVGKMSDVLWMAADDILLTTTVDNQAIMDAYAVVKTLRSTAETKTLHLILNKENDEQAARELYGRVKLCCSRFLDVSADWGCRVPYDARFTECDNSHRPMISRYPDAQAAQSLSDFAYRLNSRNRGDLRDSDEPTKRRAA